MTSSTALTNTTGSTTAKTSLGRLAALKSYAKANNVAMHQFMRFDGKRAVYIVRDSNASGENSEIEIPVGTEMAMNINEITRGFVYWKDKKQHGSRMENVWTGKKVVEKDLPELFDPAELKNDEKTKEGWAEQMTIPMKNLKTNEEFLFQASNRSSITQMDKFMVRLAQQAVMHDIETEAPLIRFNRAFFIAKGNGEKVYYPKFDIVGWVSLADADFTKPKPRTTGDADSEAASAVANAPGPIRRQTAEDSENVD